MYKLLRSFLVLSLILLIGSVSLAAEPKVLKYRISETDTLDPAQAGSEESAVITTAIYESLVQGTRDGRLLPALAESWTVSDDFRTITFKLRKGVTFHDGTPFNAEAVKYNWDRTFKIQKVGIGNMLTACDADSFRVVDEYTFQVVLPKPWPRFVNDISSAGYFIVSPTFIKKHLTASDPTAENFLASHACGTGPFKLAEWQDNQRIVLERNAEYWGGVPDGKTAPKVDKVACIIVKDPTTARLMLEKGDLHVVDRLTQEQLGALKGQPGITIAQYSVPRSIYLTMDVTKPPFDDLNVRRAMSCAINYRELITYVEKGTASPQRGIIPKGTPGWLDDIGYDYDLKKAKAYLKQSKYPKGFKTTLIYASERHQEFDQLVVYLQAYLQQIGIDVNIQKVTFDNQMAMHKKGDYGISLMSWFSEREDAENTAGYLYDFERCPTGWNASFWNDPEIERLKRITISTPDDNLRVETFKQMNRIGAEQAVYVPLYQLNKVYANSTRVKGFFYNVLNRTHFWSVDLQ